MQWMPLLDERVYTVAPLTKAKRRTWDIAVSHAGAAVCKNNGCHNNAFAGSATHKESRTSGIDKPLYPYRPIGNYWETAAGTRVRGKGPGAPLSRFGSAG